MNQNITGKNYGTTNRVVQLKIDELFAEKVIPSDDSVRLLDQIVEEMDLTPLMRAYSELGRKPATAPSTMLRVLLYANMEAKLRLPSVSAPGKQEGFNRNSASCNGLQHK